VPDPVGFDTITEHHSFTESCFLFVILLSVL